MNTQNPAQDVSDALDFKGALEALESLDDCARMEVGVAPHGPYAVLRNFITRARELQQAQVVGEFRIAPKVPTPDMLVEMNKGLDYGWAHAYERLWSSLPQSSAPVVGDEPDLFWDDNDPEFARESIDEVVQRRWEDGNLVTGDTVTVQRAIRLSNVTVIATVPDEYPDGDTEITYTDAESALTGRG